MPIILVIGTLKQEGVYEFLAILEYLATFSSCWSKE